MKRVWRILDSPPQPAELFCFPRLCAKPTSSTTAPIAPARSSNYMPFFGEICTQSGSGSLPSLAALFSDKPPPFHLRAKEDMREKVGRLRDDLLENAQDRDRIAELLAEEGDLLLNTRSNGGALVDLLRQLCCSWPALALEVFNWRRTQSDCSFTMTSEEYAKGITVAGRLNNVGLARKLFAEAAKKHVKTASTYNALMAAYTYNNCYDKCQSLLRDFKREEKCSPTVVTYNIFISVFGRLMLVDHMETAFQEIKCLNLLPNLSTYNNLIAGYVTAWMWDKMEQVFNTMKAGPVFPDVKTYTLMLRGYIHARNLPKMEEMYDLTRSHVNYNEVSLIRSMIRAYCNSSATNKVAKISPLLKLLPGDEYKPWVNVMLIKLYAQENMVEEMENLISEAFERKISVTSWSVMRSIIGNYFRCNVVDRLTNFVKRAECAGWKIGLALYHSRMVMYGSEKRLDEMEGVLREMENVNLPRSKKTLVILYKAYQECGQRHKVEKVLGLMYKQGYEIASEKFPS